MSRQLIVPPRTFHRPPCCFSCLLHPLSLHTTSFISIDCSGQIYKTVHLLNGVPLTTKCWPTSCSPIIRSSENYVEGHVFRRYCSSLSSAIGVRSSAYSIFFQYFVLRQVSLIRFITTIKRRGIKSFLCLRPTSTPDCSSTVSTAFGPSCIDATGGF